MVINISILKYSDVIFYFRILYWALKYNQIVLIIMNHTNILVQ